MDDDFDRIAARVFRAYFGAMGWDWSERSGQRKAFSLQQDMIYWAPLELGGRTFLYASHLHFVASDSWGRVFTGRKHVLKVKPPGVWRVEWRDPIDFAQCDEPEIRPIFRGSREQFERDAVLLILANQMVAA